MEELQRILSEINDWDLAAARVGPIVAGISLLDMVTCGIEDSCVNESAHKTRDALNRWKELLQRAGPDLSQHSADLVRLAASIDAPQRAVDFLAWCRQPATQQFVERLSKVVERFDRIAKRSGKSIEKAHDDAWLVLDDREARDPAPRGEVTVRIKGGASIEVMLGSTTVSIKGQTAKTRVLALFLCTVGEDGSWRESSNRMIHQTLQQAWVAWMGVPKPFGGQLCEPKAKEIDTMRHQLQRLASHLKDLLPLDVDAGDDGRVRWVGSPIVRVQLGDQPSRGISEWISDLRKSSAGS